MRVDEAEVQTGAGRHPWPLGGAGSDSVSSPFVHLHCHSEYSILDGACRIKELVRRAAELEMPAVTVTDHGSMAGAVDLYRRATKAGVKPLIGCEVYVVDDRTRKERTG